VPVTPPIISPVYRHCTLAAALILGGALFSAVAQSAKPTRAITIHAPSWIPPEQINIRSVLYGPFGAKSGEPVREPNATFGISTLVNGQAAKSAKLVVWAPGCRIEKFEVTVTRTADLQRFFLCDPLPTTKLVGFVQPPSLLEKKSSEVNFSYVANWECRFFGLMDCVVPQLDLGAAQPDATGRFEIDLPDFSDDPNTNEFLDGGELQVMLREVGTLNRILDLEPQSRRLRTTAGGLRIAPSYPDELVFSPMKSR
jgi:hypothetical protein